MTASQKAAFTERTLLVLLNEQADLAQIPGERFTLLSVKEGSSRWVRYPESRTEIEETISVLIRSLANAHGIPASYPPMG